MSTRMAVKRSALSGIWRVGWILENWWEKGRPLSLCASFSVNNYIRAKQRISELYLANAYSILEEVVMIVVVPNTRQISGKLVFVRISI